MEHSQIFYNLIVLLGSATLVATVFHTLRLPPVVGFLVAGILAGPKGLGLVDSMPEVNLLTEIGAILLMFTIGLEFSLRQFINIKRMLIGLGSAQMLFTIAGVSWFCSAVLDVQWQQALFFGCLAALSSSAVVIKLLQDNRDMHSPFGQAGLSILLFQDLIVIPIILFLPVLAGSATLEISSLSWPDIQDFIARASGLILFVLLGARYVVPFLLDRVVKTRSREVFFFSILFVCAGTAFMLESLGLSLSLGAFFAGIMISESPYGKQATSDFTPLRDNFLGLFFVAIGMLLDLSFLWSHLDIILGLVLALFVIKFFVIFTVIWMTGSSSSLGIVTGMILVQMGEFSFILAEQGAELGLLSPVERQYFLAASIVSLGLTPLFYKWAPKIGFRTDYENILPRQVQNFASQVRNSIIRHPLQIPIKSGDIHGENGPISGHTVIVGYGIAGQNAAAALKDLDIPYRIIEMNNQTVKTYAEKGEPIIFGDASKEHILHTVSLDKALLVIVAISGPEITAAVLQTIHRIRPDIRVIVRAQYLRDLKRFDLSENTEPVIAEFETTLEILTRTLSTYGVRSRQIHEFVLEARKKLSTSFHTTYQSVHTKIDLPAWECFSYIRPFLLKDGSWAIGKTVLETNLRQLTQVSLVAVYREGLGTTVPHAGFELESSDVLYLIGVGDNLDVAEKLLSEGPDASKSDEGSEDERTLESPT